MRKLFFLGLILTLLASCDKDDSNSIIDPVETKDYFPLKIGNYWIYKHYDIDSIGNVTERNRTDSVIISRDSIINSNQYFILEGTNYPFNSKWGIVDILRDSSGYLVNEKGKIKFSVDNFTDTLVSKVELHEGDTIYSLTFRMEKLTNPITVPAGEFEVLNFKGTVKTPLQIPGTKNPRYMNNLFAENVGKVLETYFYLGGPLISEKRLVRYKVETE
jgi:hypothetical protein